MKKTSFWIILIAAVALLVDIAMLEEFYAMTLSGAHRPQKIVTMTAGALLFVLSDAMLLTRIVRKITSKKYNYLCLGIYFLAQFLIAASAAL